MRNGSTVGLIVAGCVVLVGGAAAGYFYMDSQQPAKPTAAPVAAATPLPTPPSSLPLQRHAIAVADEYTAPGAPNIQISETKAPVPPKITPPKQPVKSEASLASAAPPAPPVAAPDNQAQTAQATTDTSAAASNATSATSVQSTSGANTQTASTSTQPTPSSSQTASSISPTPPTTVSAPASPTYHVEAGAFESQKNAQILEDALRHKGYAVMTVHHVVDGADSYIVQVGAYRNQATADEVVGSLQHDGFPASVSTK